VEVEEPAAVVDCLALTNAKMPAPMMTTTKARAVQRSPFGHRENRDGTVRIFEKMELIFHLT